MLFAFSDALVFWVFLVSDGTSGGAVSCGYVIVTR